MTRLASSLGRTGVLPDLLWTHIETVAAQAGLSDKVPDLVEFFGTAELADRTTQRRLSLRVQ